MSEIRPFQSRFSQFITAGLGSLIALLFAVVGDEVAAAQPLPTNSPPFQASFAWDPSPDPGVYYTLYLSNSPAAYTNVNVGTNLSARFGGMTNGNWKVFATAGKGGVESVPSNVILFIVPKPVPAFRVTLMGSTNLTAPGSNLGFFWVTYP